MYCFGGFVTTVWSRWFTTWVLPSIISFCPTMKRNEHGVTWTCGMLKLCCGGFLLWQIELFISIIGWQNLRLAWLKFTRDCFLRKNHFDRLIVLRHSILGTSQLVTLARYNSLYPCLQLLMEHCCIYSRCRRHRTHQVETGIVYHTLSPHTVWKHQPLLWLTTQSSHLPYGWRRWGGGDFLQFLLQPLVCFHHHEPLKSLGLLAKRYWESKKWEINLFHESRRDAGLKVHVDVYRSIYYIDGLTVPYWRAIFTNSHFFGEDVRNVKIWRSNYSSCSNGGL